MKYLIIIFLFLGCTVEPSKEQPVQEVKELTRIDSITQIQHPDDPKLQSIALYQYRIELINSHLLDTVRMRRDTAFKMFWVNNSIEIDRLISLNKTKLSNSDVRKLEGVINMLKTEQLIRQVEAAKKH